MSKRFYHIAFELGVPPRTFIRELSGAGLSVGNQMVVIADELESRIREVWTELHAPPEPEVQQEAPAPDRGVAVEATAPAGDDAAAEVAAEAPTETRPDGGPAVEEGTGHAETAPPETPAVEVPAPSTADREGEREPAMASAAAGSPEGGDGVPTTGVDDNGKRKPPRAGDAPKPLDLVPAIDPRAGRLVKEAPRGGIPGVTAPPRGGRTGDVRIQDLNPTIPQSERAPGHRRDSHRRSTVPERYRGKRGKETFSMRRRSRTKRIEPARPRPTEIEVEPPTTVKRFSELSGIKAAEVVKIFFTKLGMVVTVNSTLDEDQLTLLGVELEIEVHFVKKETAEEVLLAEAQREDAPEDLVPRPPVVTILGHVDHGKTTLLDAIRKSDVASREAGGITQHISASQISLPDGRRVTFIDTPGHEAFTEMRARGAQVTDIVVLIVAADDGVMPQTIEAISHVKAANVPMVVAITKIDKDNARVTRVKQQLTEHDVFVEGYGGDVSAFEVSGITKEGIPELLDHLVLFSEVEAERFQANPKRRAVGTVTESQNSPRRGVLVEAIVQNGTLRTGDAILAGEAWGTVRALFNYRAERVDHADPSDPIEIIGIDRPPEAGSKFYVLEDKDRARDIAGTRRQKRRELELAAQSKPSTIESLFGAIEQGKINELNIVLKADVKGSLEPIKGLLDRLGTDEVRVKVIHSAVGGVNDSDVVLANASNAWIIGFGVSADDRARDRAKMVGVEIRTYRIIYDIEQDVRLALEGKLTPEQREVVLGHAEIVAIFQSSKLGKIAGCRVKDGIIRRDGRIRVQRGGEVVHTTGVASLRREKDEAREVKDGFECGIRLDGWDAFEEGDILECFTVEEVARTLS